MFQAEPTQTFCSPVPSSNPTLGLVTTCVKFAGGGKRKHAALRRFLRRRLRKSRITVQAPGAVAAITTLHRELPRPPGNGRAVWCRNERRMPGSDTFALHYRRQTFETSAASALPMTFQDPGPEKKTAAILETFNWNVFCAFSGTFPSVHR